MTTGYRDTALACPACRETLDPRQVGDAIIDVCAQCGGIWVDWFDGDLVTMVRGAPPARGATPLTPVTPVTPVTPLTPVTPAASTADPEAGAQCPRCHRPLDGERYLESPAEILRCADCAGAFVPRASVSTLVTLAPQDTGLKTATDPLTRLAVVLRRWLGWSEP